MGCPVAPRHCAQWSQHIATKRFRARRPSLALVGCLQVSFAWDGLDSIIVLKRSRLPSVQHGATWARLNASWILHTQLGLVWWGRLRPKLSPAKKLKMAAKRQVFSFLHWVWNWPGAQATRKEAQLGPKLTPCYAHVGPSQAQHDATWCRLVAVSHQVGPHVDKT